jgi:hypothetical protein
MNAKGGWIGVDLDGTLAHYDEFIAVTHVGEPIKPMVNRVLRWLDEGREVRILTARVALSRPAGERAAATFVIGDWCEKHLGRRLEVTSEKDLSMIELWDDRCVAVEQNTGRALSRSRRGLDMDKNGELD